MNDENSESKSNTHGRQLFETGLSICGWVKSGDVVLYWIICKCMTRGVIHGTSGVTSSICNIVLIFFTCKGMNDIHFVLELKGQSGA